MVEIFKEVGDKFLKVFVDNFNIHNETWEGHLQDIHVVLQWLKEVNLKLNIGKCCFTTKNIMFFNHVVNN